MPHHGLDLRDPGQRYSAGDLRTRRPPLGSGRSGRGGRVPLLVGGTGFFLSVLMRPIFREPPLEGGRRRALEGLLGELPREELERWVRALDPERAAAPSGLGGWQRMIRVLTVGILTGRRLSWWHGRHPTEADPLLGVVCRLRVPRRELGERIGRRGVRNGGGGVPRGGGRTAGCRIRARRPGDGWGGGTGRWPNTWPDASPWRRAAERTARATRRYAKRQRTWFRHQLGPDAVEVDGTAPPAVQARAVVGAWRERVRRTPGGRGVAGVAGADAECRRGARRSGHEDRHHLLPHLRRFRRRRDRTRASDWPGGDTRSTSSPTPSPSASRAFARGSTSTRWRWSAIPSSSTPTTPWRWRRRSTTSPCGNPST